jgi:mannitol/fructose-specific phosphotransferase system IIA component (Ntr-type)/Kef-type K+ transport system membrane component KefB
MLLSQSLLGQLPLPGFPAGLQSLTTPFRAPGGALPALVLAALLALLFQVGLETDIRLIRLIRRSRPRGVWIGLAGSAGILSLGAVALHFCGRLPGGPVIPLFSTSGLILCTAVSFSSVSPAARVLARLQRLDSPEGLGMMSAAVADRLTGMLWLIFTAGALACWPSATAVCAPNWAAWAVVRAIVFAVPVGLAGWLIARWLGRLPQEPATPSATATLLLAMLLMLIGGAGHSVLALPGGAFLVGLALAHSDWRQALQARLEFVHQAFVPACFAWLGMCVDLRLFAEPAFVRLGGCFLAAILAGKLLGTRLPAWVAGYNTRGWLRIGLGLMPRGEVALSVAMIGFVAGRLSETALALIVLVVLATTLLAAPFFAPLFGDAKQGVRIPFPEPPPRQMRFTFSSPDTARAMLLRLIDVLEAEGFRVQLLNRQVAIYQLSKERTALGLRLEGVALIVDCAAADHPLVNSAMLEVLAGIQQHLLELKRPLDALDLQRHVAEGGQPDRTPDKVLAGMFSVNTMRPRLLADNKAAAITELIELLDDEGLIHDRHAALGAVIVREEGMSTGLENGIAIPHARTHAVDRLVCAVGMRQEGIDFGTPDNSPARIIILLLAPLDTPAPQLQAIAHLSRILNEQGRAALLACDSAEDMLDVLTGGSASRGRHGGSSPAFQEGPLAALQWPRVALDLQGRTKEAIIDQLLALCARSGAVTDLAEARRNVLARESKGSTGMEHGIALPHARTEAVTRMVCALGISRGGVDFDSMDGEPARIFFMVLMPMSVMVEYTRLTGALMRALDEPGRLALLAATSGREAVDILARGMQPH